MEGTIEFKQNITLEQADAIVKKMLRSLNIDELEMVEDIKLMQVIEVKR